MVLADLATFAPDRLLQWRTKPMAFVEDNWPGFKPEPWQLEFFEAACDPKRNKRICLLASAGVGKSAGLAIEALRRLSAYGRAADNEWPKGAAVSMTVDNLKDNLWAEIGKWLTSSRCLKDLFRQTAERVARKGKEEQWFLSARGWSKKANPEEQGRVLSGLHSAFPFVIMDESATIPLAVGRTATQIETVCEDSLIAQAGNPTTQEGCLYHAATEDRGNQRVINITSDPDDPKRCTRISKEWAHREVYGDPDADPPVRGKGRDDPWVMAFILGQFPPGGINQLLSPEQVDEAINRNLKPHEYEYKPKCIGIDVAAGGMDATSIIRRQGNMVWFPDRYRGLTGRQGAAKVADIGNRWGVDGIFIDATGGWGLNWIERLEDIGYKPHRVQYAGKPIDAQFGNKRAEIWWKMREAVLENLQLPNCTELRKDLITPTYCHKGDKLYLEDKDSIRARMPGGRSTDDGDSLANTWALPIAVTPADPWEQVIPLHKRNQCLYDDHKSLAQEDEWW